MFLARDVMATNVVSLSPNDSASDAIQILLQNEISGAPELDDSGLLVGIISEFQLLAVLYEEQIKSVRVEDLMTTNVLAVTDDTPLCKIADLLISQRIRRVPVVHKGRLVGLVAYRDLLRFAVGDHPGCLDAKTLVRLAEMRTCSNGAVASVSQERASFQAQKNRQS